MACVQPSFWKDKKVFLTGHTGFKGGWLSIWLTSMGAKVTGYSLEPFTKPNFFQVANVKSLMHQSIISDIRNLDTLKASLINSNAEIVFHLAAQPLVRYSYSNPIETYSTNVMGTVNLLESIRQSNSVRSSVIVTTDKCYENKEWAWGYRENEPMGGHDPYSSSKGCAELVTNAYKESYFSKNNYLSHRHALASARAGNVIGGGDWSLDRLIPDAIKAFEKDEPLIIRNPLATRPWQHVLEPLSGYLILAQNLYEKGMEFSGPWNFGPKDDDNRSVQEVIEVLIKNWGNSARWELEGNEQPHEAFLLKLDCSKARKNLSWVPKWNLEIAINKIVQWHQAYHVGQDVLKISLEQIQAYQSNNF